MMFGEKGQEAAPFELLVAVIIMTFVVIVGTTALMTMQKEKCKGEIESAMEQFRTAIERVSIGKGKQSVDFSPPSCFKEEATTIRIRMMDEPEICAAHCGGGQSLCTLLIFDAADEFSSWKCLHISPNTEFSGDTGICPDEEVAPHYCAVKLREGSIPTGQYILVSRFHATSSFPIVCAYRYAPQECGE